MKLLFQDAKKINLVIRNNYCQVIKYQYYLFREGLVPIRYFCLFLHKNNH